VSRAPLGSRPGRRRGGALLVAVFLAALIPRLVGIDYGLPHRFHADEAHEVFRALRLGAGDFDFDLSRALKGGLFYLLFLEYAAIAAIGLLSGRFDSPAALGHLFARDPSELWLVGRAPVACCGAATVALIWRWRDPGEAERGRALPVGPLAAALLAASFLHVKESQLIGLEVPLGFLALAQLTVLRGVIEGEGGRRRSWAAGALLGAAAMIKITGWALLFPFWLAHWMGPRRRLRRRMTEGLALAIAVYLIGNPGVVANAPRILAMLVGSFTGAVSHQLFDAAMLGGRRGPALYFEALQLAFGWLGCLAALGGALWAFRRRRRPELLLLAFTVPYLVVLCGSRTVAVHRYIVPLLPCLALLAAGLAAEISGGRRHARAAVLAATCLALLEPAWRTLRWDAELRGDDTRGAALRWIEAHLPAGAPVLLEGNRTFPAAQTVPLPIAAQYLARQAALYRSTDPGKARYLTEFAIPAAQRRADSAFQPVYLDPFDASRGLEDYLSDGARWAVLSDRIAANYASEDAWQKAPAIARLYSEIWARGQIVARFEPIPWRRAGPLISVLRFDGAAPGADLARGVGS